MKTKAILLELMKRLQSDKMVDLSDLIDSYAFNLIPEQPKQLEAVIVVPISRSSTGWNDLGTALDSIHGLSKDAAHRLRRIYPDRVTIREREKGAK